MKEIKPKKCRNCKKKFTPMNSLQIVCGYGCALEMNKKRRDKLQNIILPVLKEMDSQEGKRGIPHTRWSVQEEVCKKYMEFFQCPQNQW